MTPAGATNEYELWARAVEGDAGAFGEIFDLHRDRVFGHALRALASRHDAEDVTAIAFLELWRHRRRVRVVNGSIIGWLLVTANYTARNSSRTRRRYEEMLRRIPLPGDTEDHADEVGARIDEEDRAATIRESFSRLSKKDQDVITLCVLEEMSVAQAAQTLGVPQGTVKSRLSRARQKLAIETGAKQDEQTILEGGAK